MFVLPSERRALRWAMRHLGAVPLTGSPLSPLCRDVWEAWWNAQEPWSSGWFRERLLDELELAARNVVQPEVLVSSLASGTRVQGWVRTRDLRPQVGDYHHHNVDDMALYGAKWRCEGAYREMLGAWWRLEETRDGWSGSRPAEWWSSRHRAGQWF